MANLPSINSNIGTYLGQPVVPVYSMINPVVGSLYFDCNMHQHLLYTGKDWVRLADHTSSMLGCGNEIREEEVLISKHPGLAELKREADEAVEKYLAYYALVKE